MDLNTCITRNQPIFKSPDERSYFFYISEHTYDNDYTIKNIDNIYHSIHSIKQLRYTNFVCLTNCSNVSYRCTVLSRVFHI